MLFSEILPFVRYARLLKVDTGSHFDTYVPLDARLFYATGGHGTIYVKNKEYEMPPFSLIVINSGTPYRIAEKAAEYIAINFNYTQKNAAEKVPIPPVSESVFSEEMLTEHCTFTDAPELSDVLYIGSIPSLKKKLQTIVNEHTQKLLYYENRSGYILAQCLTDSMRLIKIGEAYDNDAENRLLSYIHENFRNNLTNRSIGDFFGYHPNYVSFLIKQLTGMPVHQYVLHLRLMHAVSLLENTAFSCEEIASLCGFCDCAYFSRYFKKQFGISPSRYRNF